MEFVYVLTCNYHDADDGNMTTVEVFSTLEKARAELKSQYEECIKDETDLDYDCSDDYEYAEVTNCCDDYHWQWEITKREVK